VLLGSLTSRTLVATCACPHNHSTLWPFAFAFCAPHAACASIFYPQQLLLCHMGHCELNTCNFTFLYSWYGPLLVGVGVRVHLPFLACYLIPRGRGFFFSSLYLFLPLMFPSLGVFSLAGSFRCLFLLLFLCALYVAWVLFYVGLFSFRTFSFFFFSLATDMPLGY
jgi:hypothetical protein